MANFIYNKITKRIRYETTKEPLVNEDEDFINDPPFAPETDLNQKLIYDGEKIRNETPEELATYKEIRRNRAITKIKESSKNWTGFSAEGVLFTKALRKVLWDQLIRIQNGEKLEEVNIIHKNLLSEIDAWSDWEDEDIISRPTTKFKDYEATSENIQNIREIALDRQSTSTSRFLPSKAALKAMYNQLKRYEDGLPIENIDKVFGNNVEQIIDEWDEFDEEHLTKVEQND